MMKKIFAGLLAIVVAYGAIKLVFWILGFFVKVFFGAIAFALIAIPVAILALPAYFYIRRKLLR